MAVGSGWQVVVAYVNVGAYYLIGLPIGCVLGYKTSLGAAVNTTALSNFFPVYFSMLQFFTQISSVATHNILFMLIRGSGGA